MNIEMRKNVTHTPVYKIFYTSAQLDLVAIFDLLIEDLGEIN